MRTAPILLRSLALTLMLLVGHAGGADAAEAVIETDHIHAELVSRAGAVAPGDVAEILIDHTLEPGWHTYWLNPGDSGEPPIFEWTLPDGGGTAEPIRFPAPTRIAYPPLMNHGYKDGFALLAGVRIPDDWPAGEPYPVTVRADWLVCEAICIPEGGKATITIPTALETTPDSSVAFRFVQAEWALPQEATGPAHYERDGDTIRLTSPVGSAQNALFFALDRDALSHTAEQTAVATDDGVILSLTGGRGRLDGTLDGVLTSADGSFWVRATGPADPEPVAAAPPPAAPQPLPLASIAPPPSAGLPQTLLFAFLGGLLLNLMPCVFPVLALKALGLVQHASAPLARRGAIAGAYTAGVFASFAVLCAVLIALKSAGVAVGWGFQLQSPAFVAAMVLLLFAVGLNLSGVYQIGTTLTRLGGHGPRDGLAGSFATGALATIVATPCTAPFMAVAVGTALAASSATAAAVFAALALGLAAPFALLCLVPGLAKILPKPGVWMERLKQALAFPLYATAAWLLWVLVQLSGPNAVLSIGVALVLLALAAWLFGLSQRGFTTSHKVATGLAAVSLIAALYAVTPALTESAPSPVTRANAAKLAVPFTPQRLADLRTEGEPVFINVTAAWCITCKVNEQVVFTSDDFETLLADRGVTYMEADWTRRDPDVTRLLDEFGRAGVPLYAYFPAGGAPVVLPQILTLSKLAAAFAS